ncbi:hypothetical protein ACMFMG_007289 [Clarireedia jacksonii]
MTGAETHRSASARSEFGANVHILGRCPVFAKSVFASSLHTLRPSRIVTSHETQQSRTFTRITKPRGDKDMQSINFRCDDTAHENKTRKNKNIIRHRPLKRETQCSRMQIPHFFEVSRVNLIEGVRRHILPIDRAIVRNDDSVSVGALSEIGFWYVGRVCILLECD